MNPSPEIETFTLDYVVELTGAPSERWIRMRLNSGQFRGRRAGRQWRMTKSDIAYLLESIANTTEPPTQPAPAPTQPAPAANPTGLTRASRRRLKRRTP
ncbi:hypothetical protein [Nocardia brasiliensis]|uniref:hypothetical protein n=1 Tax=Nocardia brasiliensis TaxID=37326 RepID=UPI002455CDE7|nr:hypothetical protein [Nocardia brasiliensis]